MTGYGKSSFEYKGKKVSIEIKSLNSKQFDLNIKAPQLYRAFESKIRNLTLAKLERGKVDVYINAEYPENYAHYTFNRSLYYKYHNELIDIARETQDKTREFLPIIMQLPDIMTQGKDETSDEEKEKLLDCFKQALEQLDNFRLSEGLMLMKDCENRLNMMLNLIAAVEPYEEQRIENVKNKLIKQLNDIENDIKTDKNRFEQELIYYLEKMDFSEEKTRFKQHCKYFSETLHENNTNGKKLSFIVQEMGREINTLGSKANDFEIQKLVVQMKDELEKIKEQLANIV